MLRVIISCGGEVEAEGGEKIGGELSQVSKLLLLHAQEEYRTVRQRYKGATSPSVVSGYGVVRMARRLPAATIRLQTGRPDPFLQSPLPRGRCPPLAWLKFSLSLQKHRLLTKSLFTFLSSPPKFNDRDRTLHKKIRIAFFFQSKTVESA